MIQYGDTACPPPLQLRVKEMREPDIKNTYVDSTRNITFEIIYYTPMGEKQMHQVLDEYYRRYSAPIPENNTTVRIICDSCGPRPPISSSEGQ